MVSFPQEYNLQTKEEKLHDILISLSASNDEEGITTIDVLEKRITEEEGSIWWQEVNTVSGYVFSREKNSIKLVPDVTFLLKDPRVKYHNGVFEFPEDLYDQIKFEEYDMGIIRKHANKPLKKDSVLSNPFWKFIAEETNRLRSYTETVYSRGGNGSKMMVFIDDFTNNDPYDPDLSAGLALWSLSSLGLPPNLKAQTASMDPDVRKDYLHDFVDGDSELNRLDYFDTCGIIHRKTYTAPNEVIMPNTSRLRGARSSIPKHSLDSSSN